MQIAGFGINEHIDLGIKYDPSTGIYGKTKIVSSVSSPRRPDIRVPDLSTISLLHWSGDCEFQLEIDA